MIKSIILPCWICRQSSFFLLILRLACFEIQITCHQYNLLNVLICWMLCTMQNDYEQITACSPTHTTLQIHSQYSPVMSFKRCSNTSYFCSYFCRDYGTLAPNQGTFSTAVPLVLMWSVHFLLWPETCLFFFENCFQYFCSRYLWLIQSQWFFLHNSNPLNFNHLIRNQKLPLFAPDGLPLSFHPELPYF